MKRILITLLILIYGAIMNVAAQSILVKVESSINEKNVYLEIYYIESDILFRSPVDEEMIQKYSKSSDKGFHFKKFKKQKYKNKLANLQKISLINKDVKFPNDVRMLVLIKQGSKVLFKISMGEFTVINGQNYEFDQKLWNLFEDMIKT